MASRGLINNKFKHLEVIDTSKFSESEWQELRSMLVQRGMVGGSDVGCIMGLNKWKSPISLYYQMLNISSLPDKMNLDMAMGKLQEDNIAETWRYYNEDEEQFVNNVVTDTKPRAYKKFKATIINPEFPLLFANTDGIITKHPVMKRKMGILEIKKANGISVDTYETGYPPSYYAQCQHYMLVLGLSYAELCMRVDGRKLNVHFFEANRNFQGLMLDMVNDFIAKVNAARKEIANVPDTNEQLQIASHFEPDADNSDAFNQFISEKHKAREEEITIQGSDEHEQWAFNYKDLSEKIKTLETDKQLFQNRLKQVMERDGATTMVLPSGKITWRKQFQVRI